MVLMYGMKYTKDRAMKKPLKYTEKDIQRMQALRRSGFSFDEISRALSIPRNTVIYYCGSIWPERNGHDELARNLSDLFTALEPTSPGESNIPLPRAAQVALQRIRALMAGGGTS